MLAGDLCRERLMVSVMVEDLRWLGSTTTAIYEMSRTCYQIDLSSKFVKKNKADGDSAVDSLSRCVTDCCCVLGTRQNDVAGGVIMVESRESNVDDEDLLRVCWRQ